jgi:hypothetical protein
MVKHVRSAALLALAGVFGCRCGETTTAIAPQIYLDVCKTPQKKVSGVLIGGFEDCGVDFGTRDLSVKVTQNIKVTNPSIVELNLFEVNIVGDPSFKVELAPDTIPAGQSGDIVISVRPKTETALAATLYILSDANNTNQTEESKSLVEVPLTVVGVDNGLPDIEVDPLSCDFGRVPQGGVQVCNVTIKNTGNRGLTLDSVAFVPVGDDPDVLFQVPPGSTTETPFAFSANPPGPDDEIAGGAEVTLPVRFAPDVLGNFQGKFRILSNDPDEEQIDVPLSGIAVTPPTCVIKIKTINGQEPQGANPAIEPLDDVILSLEDSTPSTPDGSIQRFQWSIGSRPAGSTVALTNELGETTGFTFDDDLGVDLAGEYTVRAQVFDDLDVGSVNECEITFEAIPKDNFLVQLSWDTSTSDIDLHVTKAGTGGEFCAGNTSGEVTGPLASDCGVDLDCNYATCRSTSSDSPEWDGVSGRGDGDPTLDIDDLEGFGPENINVDVMTPGRYLVSVEGFTLDTPTTGCTVRIFVYGRLAAEFFKSVGEDEWWEAAVVEWPADPLDPVCIEDLNDGDLNDDIPRCQNGG